MPKASFDFEDSKYTKYHEIIEDIYFNNFGNLGAAGIAKTLISQYPDHKLKVNSLRQYIGLYLKDNVADKEIIESNVRLAKQKQAGQDVNRIERKSFREYARVENALEVYGIELTKQNKQFGEALAKINIVPIKKSKVLSGVGIMQITDVHGNELIDLPHNKYDFHILSQRLKKYVDESISYFKYKGAKKVLIAFTGDLLNSDRRLDELLNSATNRSKATVMMIHIFKQAILEVRNAGFEVDIISVLGNESRVNKEMTFSNEAFSDNYDFTIVAQLKQMFEFAEIKGINFGSHSTLEVVVNVAGQNWLFAHDLNKYTSSQLKAQSAIGRYSLQNIKIDFMIGGHIHATNITDISSRSGSMSGSNSFNENALNLAGRAMGTCYFANGSDRNCQTIDLQTSDNEGYEVETQLEAYNIKSASKVNKNTTVFKVVI